MKPGTKFISCSDKVAAALGPDVMKTVKPLIPDLLAALPVLLYQGMPRVRVKTSSTMIYHANGAELAIVSCWSCVLLILITSSR